MELKEMIYKRKSFRKYTGQPVGEETLQKILDFAGQAKPLYPEIRTEAKIVTKEQVRFYFPWKTPQLLAVYSENKPGYLENVGFIFQQVDLYLQSLGLGCCWLGLGKLREQVDGRGEEGMEFVILLAFGTPAEALRQGPSDFHRKAMAEIADREDPALEPARLAPSSTNSQPWYFTHQGNTVHAFCSRGGILKHRMLGTMNRIDMGIALAHMYVSNPETFQFFCQPDTAAPEGYAYTGSFRIAE